MGVAWCLLLTGLAGYTLAVLWYTGALIDTWKRLRQAVRQPGMTSIRPFGGIDCSWLEDDGVAGMHGDSVQICTEEGTTGDSPRRIFDVSRRESLVKSTGLLKCPWMHRPADFRYPRQRLSSRCTPRFSSCLARLANWQAQGHLLLSLYEGSGLGALTSGGFHGDCAGDGDLDVLLSSELFPNWVEEHCEVDSGLARNIDKYLYIKPVAGVPFRAHLRKQVIPYLTRDNLWRRTDLPSGYPCVCEYEGFEMLCPPAKYFIKLYGGSWWVPSLGGGKNTGHHLRAFMIPPKPNDDPDNNDDSICVAGSGDLFCYFHWLEDTNRGLANQLVDPNGDGDVSIIEFLAYVRSSKGVNQLWLDHAMREEPCVVANAQIHYNHTLRFSSWAISLRRRCGNRFRFGNRKCHEECG